jgi:hypothetical protein
MQDFCEADAGTRTPDPFITSEVLYQLSYVGLAGQSTPGSAPPAGRYGSIGSPRLTALARQSSARTAHRSWSRHRPPIFR